MRREYQEGVLTNEKRDYYLVHVLSLIDGAEDDAHHDGGDDLNPGDQAIIGSLITARDCLQARAANCSHQEALYTSLLDTDLLSLSAI